MSVSEDYTKTTPLGERDRLAREAQRFLQRYLTSQDFRILLVDGTTRVLVEQLISSEQLQRGNVCMLLDIGQASQLTSILQQDLAKVVCILSPSSSVALIGVLNANYLSLDAFKVLFTGPIALEQLGQLQVSQERLSIPAGFSVTQTSLDVSFIGGVATSRSLDSLVSFYLAQANRFQTTQAPHQVSIIGREGLTDFNAYKQRLSYLKTLRDQQGNFGEHLVIVDRNAFLDQAAAWEMAYGGFLRKFAAELSCLLALRPVRADIFRLVESLDEYRGCGSSEILQKMAAFLNVQAPKEPASMAVLFGDERLIKMPFGEAAQEIAARVQKLNAQEKEIMEKAKVSLISKHEREKQAAQDHLLCQLFLAEFGKRTPLRLLVDVSQKMRSSRKAAGDVIQALQGKKFEHKFVRRELAAQFFLSQENASAYATPLLQALEIGTPEKTQTIDAYQKLLAPQERKLTSFLGDTQTPRPLDALQRQPKHPFDPVAQQLWDAPLAPQAKITVLVDGPAGPWETFDGQVIVE